MNTVNMLSNIVGRVVPWCRNILLTMSHHFCASLDNFFVENISDIPHKFSETSS